MSRNAAVVFVCVPTPSSQDGSLDATEVWAAIDEVEPNLANRCIVAVKSTVSPGTTALLAAAFPRIELASVPEFLIEARPTETLTKPDDRGVWRDARHNHPQSRSGLHPLGRDDYPVVTVRPTEAELIELCSNAMLAAKVTLANELVAACECFGVAWSRVQEGVGMDRRIGPPHLGVTPDRGVRWQLSSQDLNGLIKAAERVGYPAPILRAIARFNREIRLLGPQISREMRPS